MFDTHDFNALREAQIEKSIRLTGIAMNGMERLFNLQLELARDLLNENVSTIKALAEVKDVPGFIALQQQIGQPIVAKTLATAKTVFQTAQTSQNEVSQLFEDHVSDFNKNLVATFDTVIKSAPGSDAAATTFKKAVETASQAYDTMIKTIKKVGVDFTEAGVAVAESTAKPASTTRARKGVATAN